MIMRRVGGFLGLLRLPATATIACVLPCLAVDAFAHVGDADLGPLASARPSGWHGADKIIRLDHEGANGPVSENVQVSASGQVSAKRTHACGFSSGENRPFAGFTLAATAPAAPPAQLSEARLDSVRAASAVYQEVLSLFEGLDATSDVVRVVEGISPDGAACPVYIAVGSGASRQTFWRFAPNDEPESWFDEEGRRLGEAAFTHPRPGSRLSSPFGPRRYYGRLSGGGFHDGIDYEARIGDPIFAAADGVIEHQGGYFEYGLTTKIRHAAQQVTLYAHMSRFAKGTAVGAKVNKGDLIGYVGMTGRSTGAHLHFSTIINGKFVDPAPYLSNTGNRFLSSLSLATFRRWQQDVLAATRSARDQQRRPQFDDVEWTKRI